MIMVMFPYESRMSYMHVRPPQKAHFSPFYHLPNYNPDLKRILTLTFKPGVAASNKWGPAKMSSAIIQQTLNLKLILTEFSHYNTGPMSTW